MWNWKLRPQEWSRQRLFSEVFCNTFQLILAVNFDFIRFCLRGFLCVMVAGLHFDKGVALSGLGNVVGLSFSLQLWWLYREFWCINQVQRDVWSHTIHGKESQETCSRQHAQNAALALDPLKPEAGFCIIENEEPNNLLTQSCYCYYILFNLEIGSQWSCLIMKYLNLETGMTKVS